MNRVVVTGGAGFIGSGLVRALLADGAKEVVVVDNLLSGKEENLTEVRDRVEFHNADIRDYDSMRKIFEDAEVVFHLAAIPSVPRSIKEPYPSHDVNINGTFSVYSAAAEAKVRRVVYAASSSAYGDTLVMPKVETMLPLPKSPYALQKLVGEYYGSVFYSCFGLESVALRFFNVFGPRQDPGSAYSGVLSLFMKCLIERQAPLIHGDGEQSRDFTYVEDVAGLVIKAAKAQGVAGNTYNAGNGNRYTLNFIWSQLQMIEGVDIPATFGPPREGDVRASQADTSMAVKYLGHSPQFPIDKALRLTLDWYKQSLKA